MDDKRIYEKLREFRRARGISVDALAKELGENSQKVGRIERGQRSLTVDYLLKVSRALSTPLEALLDDREEESESANFNSDVLNDVVLLVEEVSLKLPKEHTSFQKGKVISKVYEQLLKLPPEQQRSFLGLLREAFQSIF